MDVSPLRNGKTNALNITNKGSENEPKVTDNNSLFEIFIVMAAGIAMLIMILTDKLIVL